MAERYRYSILNDFPNSMVNTSMLTIEIKESSISETLSHINTWSDNCDIWFDSALTSPDETELDEIVATHSGTEPTEELYFPANCYAYAEALDESSTTSTDFVEKLSLSVKDVPPGIYRIGWSFEWSFSVTLFQDFLARVQFNNTFTLSNLKIQPRNCYADDAWQHVGGFAKMEIDTLGDYDIDLDFATTGGIPPRASYIRNARLELWRIS